MENKEPRTCEVCGHLKSDVRFEGLTENFICDTCLYKYKKWIKIEGHEDMNYEELKKRGVF